MAPKLQGHFEPPRKRCLGWCEGKRLLLVQRPWEALKVGKWEQCHTEIWLMTQRPGEDPQPYKGKYGGVGIYAAEGKDGRWQPKLCAEACRVAGFPEKSYLSRVVGWYFLKRPAGAKTWEQYQEKQEHGADYTWQVDHIHGHREHIFLCNLQVVHWEEHLKKTRLQCKDLRHTVWKKPARA